MTRRITVLAGLLFTACSCGGAPASTEPTTTPTPEATRGGMTVEMMAPGLDRARFVHASLTDGSPLVITGCVMPERAPCEESMRVVLDDDAGEELDALLDDLGETPRCEPAGIEPGDREFTLTVEGGATYTGPIPADPTRVAARAAGPCRADARLAWWLARWLVGATRPSGESPSRITVTVDATNASGPRFVNATVDLAASSIEGCTSSARGECAATRRVALEPPAIARLGALLEDVRSEPCHTPFPAGAALELEAGLVYDGPCGADADLAWWVGAQLDPDAIAGH